jgi:hypothetical protein
VTLRLGANRHGRGGIWAGLTWRRANSSTSPTDSSGQDKAVPPAHEPAADCRCRQPVRHGPGHAPRATRSTRLNGRAHVTGIRQRRLFDDATKQPDVHARRRLVHVSVSDRPVSASDTDSSAACGNIPPTATDNRRRLDQRDPTIVAEGADGLQRSDADREATISSPRGTGATPRRTQQRF